MRLEVRASYGLPGGAAGRHCIDFPATFAMLESITVAFSFFVTVVRASQVAILRGLRRQIIAQVVVTVELDSRFEPGFLSSSLWFRFTLST
jgi:hypothetical protein